MTGLPTRASPVFDHLKRLSDSIGLFEHARYDVPRPEHGYCVDDAARALVVVVREDDPTLRALGDRYLGLCVSAVAPDGRCHNRMSAAGRWTDRPGLGDSWGRALWGLGVTAVRGPREVRPVARKAFVTAARRRSPDRRALAFASLGACEVLTTYAGTPVGEAARSLLSDAARSLDAPGDAPGWPWPEPRLTYANAALPEAMLAVGAALGRDDLVARGLELLAWLLATETSQGRLSVTPVGGRGPGEHPPGFDQQPIEVGAIAEACARAHDLTGESRWLDGVAASVRWFHGDNDAGVPLVDASAGAAFDGLTPSGRNENRGAESTLAMLATFQQATRLGLS